MGRKVDFGCNVTRTERSGLRQRRLKLNFRDAPTVDLHTVHMYIVPHQTFTIEVASVLRCIIISTPQMKS
jgi:hypothetical protein